MWYSKYVLSYFPVCFRFADLPHGDKNGKVISKNQSFIWLIILGNDLNFLNNILMGPFWTGLMNKCSWIGFIIFVCWMHWLKETSAQQLVLVVWLSLAACSICEHSPKHCSWCTTFSWQPYKQHSFFIYQKYKY